jgi:preprotein translocase subunit SecF
MNITKLRNVWFSISGLLLIASVGVMIVFGFQLGLDFTGGARWQLKFDKTTTQSALTDFFATQTQLTQTPVIQATDNNMFLITLEDLSDDDIKKLSDALTSRVGTFTEESYQKVNSNVGASFKRKSIMAVIVALGGIILFVAFAFRKIPASINPWRFGSVAIIALFHDILIVLGVFVLLGYYINVELDLTFITALLATLGFSVNDTIVILDRVRENIRLQKIHETFEDTIEKSIKQTLFRSINTSLSTLFPLIGLLIFGAESIFFFVLALTLGIVVGTYSSIFLAAPLLVSWKNWGDARN